MMTAEEVKKEGTIEIMYVPLTEAIELIRNIRTTKDNLSMDMAEWIKWGEDVVGRLCDMFDISEKELYYK